LRAACTALDEKFSDLTKSELNVATREHLVDDLKMVSLLACESEGGEWTWMRSSRPDAQKHRTGGIE
jgi:hypothetical protein